MEINGILEEPAAVVSMNVSNDNNNNAIDDATDDAADIDTAKIDKLHSAVKSKKGTVLSTDADGNIQIKCVAGHIYETNDGVLLQNWCIICELLKKMRKLDKKLICLTNVYNWSTKSMQFKCSRGHVFRAPTDRTKCRQKCRTCFLEEKLNSVYNDGRFIIDTKCVLNDEQSKMRIHCVQQKHNPLCLSDTCVEIMSAPSGADSCSPGCRDFITCGDFYIMESMIIRGFTYECTGDEYHFNCALSHWNQRGELHIVFTTLHCLELLFNERFDDELWGAGVTATAYCEKLNIVVTCSVDRNANKCAERTRKWCNKNGKKFYYFQVTSTTKEREYLELMCKTFELDYELYREQQLRIRKQLRRFNVKY